MKRYTIKRYKQVMIFAVFATMLFLSINVHAATNKVGTLSSGMPKDYYGINTRFVSSSGYIQFYEKKNSDEVYAEISENGTINTISFSMKTFSRTMRVRCGCGPYGNSYVYGGELQAKKKSNSKWQFTYILQTGAYWLSHDYSIVYNYTPPSTEFTTTRLTKDSNGNYRIAWKAKSKNEINGYELQVSRDSRFKSVGTTRISNYRQNYIGINKNTRGVFYIRIRTYKVINGKTYYSDWCKKGIKLSL